MRISDWSSDVCSSDLAAQADADDTRLTLTAEIARQYIALRASRQRLEIARYLLTNQQKIADLTAQLEGAGKVSRIEREQTDRGVEARRQTVAALEAEVNDHKIGRASCRESECQ